MDWIAEIDELHAYFQEFFLGRVSSIARVETALGPGFTMVTPDGSVSDRDAVLDLIRSGHGHTSALTIETSNHSLVLETDDLVVATYIETHHLSDRRNDRRTTAVFSKDAEGRHGVRWLHVHETFLPVH